jgi:hypothetical protein
MKTTTVTLVGTAGHIQHSNAILADPIHPMKKAIDRLVKAKNKTEEEIREAYRLEFIAGLYVSEEGRVVIPSDNINRMLQDAGAKHPRFTRPKVQSAVFCQTTNLMYENPEKPGEDVAERLWEREGFRLIRPAKNGGRNAGTVMRSRPIFNRWAAKVEVLYDPSVLDADDVLELFALAGRMIGLSDWRPKHGTFRVLELAEGDEVKYLKDKLSKVAA